jgi:hypothetical protein
MLPPQADDRDVEPEPKLCDVLPPQRFACAQAPAGPDNGSMSRKIIPPAKVLFMIA